MSEATTDPTNPGANMIREEAIVKVDTLIGCVTHRNASALTDPHGSQYASSLIDLRTELINLLSSPRPPSQEEKPFDSGELWSMIRSGLGYIRDDMKLAVGADKYEIESAYFDIMARSLADTVIRQSKLRRRRNDVPSSPPPSTPEAATSQVIADAAFLEHLASRFIYIMNNVDAPIELAEEMIQTLNEIAVRMRASPPTSSPALAREIAEAVHSELKRGYPVYFPAHIIENIIAPILARSTPQPLPGD